MVEGVRLKDSSVIRLRWSSSKTAVMVEEGNEYITENLRLEETTTGRRADYRENGSTEVRTGGLVRMARRQPR